MQARKFIVAVAAVLLAAGAAQADVFNMGSNLTSLTFVTVGDLGNAADVYTGGNGTLMGSVGYTYQMGKYDVTVAQYCEFLNAVAKTDPYNLYSTSMANSTILAPYVGCGIVRTGSPGSYSYNISSAAFSANNENFPVNWVSSGDVARFCNWLTNGQPTGSEGAGTTETGSYTLNGATDNTELMAVTRNADARYVIPTENEWYKAAYYDPTLNGGAGGYWQYPTKSNTVPSNNLSSTGTNNANFRNDYGIYSDPTNYLTVVGAFASSPGPYGTYDMGGDVRQWTETNGNNYRIQRGGSYYTISGGLWASYYTLCSASRADGYVGFRVCEVLVPEPGSVTLAVLGSLVILRRVGSRKPIR